MLARIKVIIMDATLTEYFDDFVPSNIEPPEPPTTNNSRGNDLKGQTSTFGYRRMRPRAFLLMTIFGLFTAARNTSGWPPSGSLADPILGFEDLRARQQTVCSLRYLTRN